MSKRNCKRLRLLWLPSGGADAGPDDNARDLIGQIASVRATLAILRYDPDAAIIQSRRALEYLHPDNLPSRGRATWTLGFGYQLQGDRAAARRVYGEAMAIRQAPGNIFFTILATTGLAQIQESDNQLHEAAESYRRSLQLFGIRNLRMPARSLSAWPASATSGTTWRPRSSTGGRASNWRGSTILRLTESSSAKCSWPA